MKSLKMSWDYCHFVQQLPGRTATLHHHNLKHSSHRVPAQHILYRYELTTFDINSQVQVVDNVEELEKNRNCCCYSFTLGINRGLKGLIIQ
jgi:hypothetical protein